MQHDSGKRRRAWFCLIAVVIGLAYSFAPIDLPATGQEPGFQVDASEIESIMTDEPEQPEIGTSTPSGIDLWTLISRGGAFMVPIGIMSFLVVALAVERSVSLRRRRVIPPALEDNLEGMLHPIGRFNPVSAWQACQRRPSPAARVVTSMLQRTGQPLADIERAAGESIQREIDRYASPIRWLTLAAAATPLMGLLGTVWGMIVAFHESTTLTADRSRSEQLSEGIYTALVTTLAGLIVAIPAAMLALYLENRLIKLFHRVEELAFEVAPGLAQFAGRQTLGADGSMRTMDGTVSTPPSPPRSSGGGTSVGSAAGASGKARGEAKTR